MYISKSSHLECSTEQDYAKLIDLLDVLIDQIGEDETHPLASMMDVIGVLI
jgi:HTH-type transcriptional regulator/antitoxin HigA